MQEEYAMINVIAWRAIRMSNAQTECPQTKQSFNLFDQINHIDYSEVNEYEIHLI